MKKFICGVVVGAVISTIGAAFAQTDEYEPFVRAEVTTSGVLKGYIVQKDGKEVCRDPSAYPDFRGLGSFIMCPDTPKK